MSLNDYIETLQANGQYSFSQEEALIALKCSKIALNHAILRLKKKNKIAVPKPNFFVIVPVEYREWGIVPANWFIDNLMKFLGRNYYVGLGTAILFFFFSLKMAWLRAILLHFNAIRASSWEKEY